MCVCAARPAILLTDRFHQAWEGSVGMDTYEQNLFGFIAAKNFFS
jgi:hypothetical protein